SEEPKHCGKRLKSSTVGLLASRTSAGTFSMPNRLSLSVLTVLILATPLHAQQPTAPPAAQQPPTTITVCGQEVATPRAVPPANSGPVVLFIAPCFEAQGNTSLIDVNTYLYYIQQKASQPSQGLWVPYDAAAEKTLVEDFRRLWATNFLDNL